MVRGEAAQSSSSDELDEEFELEFEDELLEELDEELFDELEIWSVGTFPLAAVPDELAKSIQQKRRVITLEDHYQACGLGEALSHLFLQSRTIPESMTSLCAAGYPSGRYGSQRFHREESGLAGPALAARLRQLIRG